MLIKKCTRCNKTFYAISIEKLSKYFYRAKLGKFGFSAVCKKCTYDNYKYTRPLRAKFKEAKPCIVCGTNFIPRRFVDTVCSKKCASFRTKIVNKMNRDKYDKEARKLAKKEVTRKNKKKTYSEKEIRFILENRGVLKIKDIAKKLDRTTRGVTLQIMKLREKGQI